MRRTAGKQYMCTIAYHRVIFHTFFFPSPPPPPPSSSATANSNNYHTPHIRWEEKLYLFSVSIGWYLLLCDSFLREPEHKSTNALFIRCLYLYRSISIVLFIPFHSFSLFHFFITCTLIQVFSLSLSITRAILAQYIYICIFFFNFCKT